jgi:hypothetical protein
MMKIARPLRLIGIALVGLAILTLPSPARSQNCALCYTQAASAGTRMIQALRSGILVLIVPPTLMWGVVTFIVYRKRNQFRPGDYPHESERSW